MMNKAIFLDRDGVLCKELGRYLTGVEEFEILPHVPKLLSKLKKGGFLLIMISNQGVISRGELTLAEVTQMHVKLQLELKKEKAVLDAMYFCTHHPEIEACLCRKPEPLMIEKALARFKIDPKKSFLIGDSPRDIEAAYRAGVKGIQIDPNMNWSSLVDSFTS